MPRTALFLLPSVVVLWRVLAWWAPSPFVPLAEDARLPLAGLGLFFAGCGVVAYALRKSRTALPFLLFGLGGGIHWGGAVGVGGEAAGLGLLLLYLAASALSEAALLHLALVFPPAWRLSRAGLVALYLPAALGAVLALLAGLLPRSALEPILGVLLAVANLLGIAAGVVFIWRLVRSDWRSPEARDLGLLVVSMLLALGLSTLGGAGLVPGGGDLWNLGHAAIPAALFWVLVKRSHPRPG